MDKSSGSNDGLTVGAESLRRALAGGFTPDTRSVAGRSFAVRQFAAWQQTRKAETDRLDAVEICVDALAKAVEDLRGELSGKRREANPTNALRRS